MFGKPLLAHPAEMGGFTPPGTRILGMAATVNNAMTTPMMSSIGFSL